MAKEVLVTCKHCGKKIPKSQAYKIKDRSYYCNQKCYQKSQDEALSYQELLRYLNVLYDNNIPQFVYIQIKKFHNEQNMKYSGIKLSLDYFINVKNGKWANDKGIGIVEYVYDEAKEYYIEQQKLKKISIQKDIEQFETIVKKKHFKKIRQKSRIDDL
jgi:hypothetical protein